MSYSQNMFTSGGGSGTVTSVALAMPTGFSVSGSPITGSGTLAVSTTLNGYIKGNGTGFTASATVATTDLSGTLQAAQFPALTGDVTTVAGALGATIAAGAVSLSKMANVATGTVFYRKTAGTGAPEVQTLATLKTDLGLTGTNSGDQTITLTGDVTGSGTGSFAATLATVNSNVGSFGSSTLIPVITVNGKGLITAISAVSASGGGLAGTATVTVPNGRYEWTETVAATGVTGSSKIIASIAAAADVDENTAEMLSINALSGTGGTNTIEFNMAFAEPTAGAIKINWSAL